MASTVKVERSRLQNEYAPLRVAILDHYLLAWQLTGHDAGAAAHHLPTKLGQWHELHSQRVLSACPELSDLVDTIEFLVSQRNPSYIKRNHVRQRPGPKAGWVHERKGPLNTPELYQLGGEYRDGYKH